MQRIGEHPVPAGPLAVRWLGYELEPARAGAVSRARVALENAGSATWHAGPPHTIAAGYHWLDTRGNPIVWDGYWQPLGRAVAPGERVEVELQVRAPVPPGTYRLAFDLVSEGRFWFSEIGNTAVYTAVDVGVRLHTFALAVRAADADVAARYASEDEAEAVAHLAPGVVPAPDWAERILAAHAEGYAVVGGAVEPAGGFLERRRAARALEPWAPGGGRNPAFERPLLCPSFLRGIEADWVEPVEGLPAARPPRDEPWVYEGRAVVRVRRPAGRRRG